MAVPPPDQPPTAGRGLDLAHLLTRAERLLAQQFTAILAESGVSMDAWRVLGLLADGAGHGMTDVAAQVYLPPASLTKLMDHMVDDNLVYRRVDELDRRRIRAYLTARGRRLHERLTAQLSDRIADLGLRDSEQALLGALLSRLADALVAAPTAHR